MLRSRAPARSECDRCRGRRTATIHRRTPGHRQGPAPRGSPGSRFGRCPAGTDGEFVIHGVRAPANHPRPRPTVTPTWSSPMRTCSSTAAAKPEPRPSPPAPMNPRWWSWTSTSPAGRADSIDEIADRVTTLEGSLTSDFRNGRIGVNLMLPSTYRVPGSDRGRRFRNWLSPALAGRFLGDRVEPVELSAPFR